MFSNPTLTTISEQGIPVQPRLSKIVDTILETSIAGLLPLYSLYNCHKDNTAVRSNTTNEKRALCVLVQVINNYSIRNLLNKPVLVRSGKQQGTLQWMCSKTCCNCKTLHCAPCYHISHLLIPNQWLIMFLESPYHLSLIVFPVQ